MIFELLLNDGLVVGVRMNFKSYAKNPPRKENLFKCNRDEFKKMIHFLTGRKVQKGIKEYHDFVVWNCYLKWLDNRDDKAYKKSSFLEMF